MKILFIAPTYVGDAVHSMGILSYLVQQNNDAKVTVVCVELLESLFKHVPGIERLIIVRKKKYSRHWLDLWCQCIGTYWDIVVDLRKSAIGHVLFSGKSYGYKKNYRGNSHRQYVNASLLGLDAPPPLKLYISEKETRKASLLLSSVVKHQFVIALGPTSNWDKKNWPIDYYIRLVQRIDSQLLSERKTVYVISCAPKEIEIIKPLLDAIPASQRILLSVGLSLLEVAACFKQCDLFIGNDSGLMHIANAVDTPTIGLFGPSRDEWYRPLGPKAMVVRTPETYGELSLHAEQYPEDNLMKTLSVDKVFAAVKRFVMQHE